MSTWITEIVQIVTALGILFNGTASLLAFLQSRRNGSSIEKVHLATNSMKDELVKVTGDAAFERGLKQGQEENIS